MRAAAQRMLLGKAGGRDWRAAGRGIRQILKAPLVLAASASLVWLVSIYGSALRDPRYLDGWVLAAGMLLQLCFHIARKTGRLSPKSLQRWKSVHILLGCVLVTAFLSHANYSLPDTGFEWALWTGFVLVSLSGVAGTFLGWALAARRPIEEGVSHDRIPHLRSALARELEAVVAATDPAALRIALPQLPYDAWIANLHASTLKGFFSGPRNLAAHLVGSQRPLERLTGTIEQLLPYVDEQGREKLASIRRLVIEKDRLDFAHAYLGLMRGWLMLHVPATYALILLSVAHVLVVYAFSSGAW